MSILEQMVLWDVIAIAGFCAAYYLLKRTKYFALFNADVMSTLTKRLHKSKTDKSAEKEKGPGSN